MKITFVYVILFLFIQGGSSIMMCLVNGEMSAQLGYTSDHSYMKIQDVGIKYISFIVLNILPWKIVFPGITISFAW
jgi:hypothetical protein